MRTLRILSFGAAGALILATGLTGFILDIVFIILAIGIVYAAIKFLK